MNKTAYTRIDKDIKAVSEKAEKDISELDLQIKTLYDRKDACDADMKKATEVGDEQAYIDSFATQKYLADRIGVLEKKREGLELHALITIPQWKEYHADILEEYRSNKYEHHLAMKEAWGTFWNHAKELQAECGRVNYLLQFIHNDILRDDFDGWRQTVPEPSKNQRDYEKASCADWNSFYTQFNQIAGFSPAITAVMQSGNDDEQIVD